MFLKNTLFILLSLTALVSCNSEGDRGGIEQDTVLTTQNAFVESTQIGNFVTTAVRRSLNVDFVFLPSRYFSKPDLVLEVREDMTEGEIDKLLESFPVSTKDQLLVGAMNGDDIKRFIIQRSQELYNVDLETAGLWYRVVFKGGFVASSDFQVEGQFPLEDDRTYRIAISDDFFFGSAFPGYKFRNGFNFNFRRERYQRSIRESVRDYLTSKKFRFPYWSTTRAEVKNIEFPDLGFKKINEIQGSAHSSPLLSHKVTTRGVVTAVGTDRWYPYDLDVYIQSQESDDDPRSSEGIHITSLDNSVDIKIGQLIEVTGYVMEEARANGMGETTLRVTEPMKVISEDNILPEPVSLAGVPIDRVSRHSGGPLMSKESLDLKDGIDFWESVEGMRVITRDLVVSGFRGGGEDLIEISDRFYLNLYVYSKESYSENLLSRSNGLMIDHDSIDHNPELFVITTNHLSKGVQVQRNNGDYYYYNIGDTIKGDVVGVMTYPKNIFGGGEYALVTPEPQDALQYRNVESEGFIPLSKRPSSKFKYEDDPNTITVNTFNLENLAGNRQDRIDVLAEVLSGNLNCPDLINLVEIQDNNGISFRGGTNADLTLKKVKIATQQRCHSSDYEFINVDPFELSEGGQPGGNIRVSVMYNQDKLDFEYRGDPSKFGAHSIPLKDGMLSVNPGRVFPLDPAFRRSRRSPVMQFSLKSKPEEQIYLIGAHLNSKLGDIDFWGNRQPAVQLSDDRRSAMSAKLNEMVRWIEQENSEANIIVLGDFNALAEEKSMAVLTENETRLRNTIFTMPENHQYTTNHNGNAQGLDYIFVNRKIYEKECTEAEYLHLNSDYMGRISDHDPVNLKVCF